MTERKKITRSGYGRRVDPVADGPGCVFHEMLEQCIERMKKSIKEIEDKQSDTRSRLSAIEPTVRHNLQEIDAMRKLQLGTLISALASAIGVISGLCVLLYNHL